MASTALSLRLAVTSLFVSVMYTPELGVGRSAADGPKGTHDLRSARSAADGPKGTHDLSIDARRTSGRLCGSDDHRADRTWCGRGNARRMARAGAGARHHALRSHAVRAPRRRRSRWRHPGDEPSH